MGELFKINEDGSITRSDKKNINNIKWLDYNNDSLKN